MLTAIVFILMLAVLILVHEAGHFTLAKIFHVTVKEFGLGFGPRIFGIKWGETEYTLNAVPLGGFVKMVGEEDPNLPGSLAGKPIGVRALVLSSGALMNIVLPIILLTASFMVPHQVLRETVYIDDVAPGSPAAIAGVKPGDVVLKMDGHKVRNRTDVSYRIALRFGSQVKLTLHSEGASPRELIVKTRWNPPEGQGPTGIRIGGSDGRIDTESLPIWQAFPRGAATVWETLVLFKNEVEGWFIRRTAPQVAGPIGIAQATGEIARAGISPIFRFASLLSLNLAIFNLLPLPALDGGRLAFVLVEWIRRGKRVSPQKEGMVHLIGFIVLLSLMALVTYLDINRIISGTSLFP